MILSLYKSQKAFKPSKFKPSPVFWREQRKMINPNNQRKCREKNILRKCMQKVMIKCFLTIVFTIPSPFSEFSATCPCCYLPLITDLQAILSLTLWDRFIFYQTAISVRIGSKWSFGCSECAHYIDRNDSFMAEDICQNWSDCMYSLNKWSLLYLNYTWKH